MSPILGNLIVIVLLAAAMALAVRSLWKSRKSGGCEGCPSHDLCHPCK